MCESYCSAVGDSALYVRIKLTSKIVGFFFSTSSLSQLPYSPAESCPPVIVNNFLTLIGGYSYEHDSYTNQLFSLNGEGSGRRWTEVFPPMSTKRQGSIAACTETVVIVAGGLGKAPIQTVEVLNTETLQWSTTAGLLQPPSYAPAAVCGDQIYILGNSNMYTCSLQV